MASPGRILIIVENLPVPLDRRVWMEATTLRGAGYEVSVICPIRKGYETPEEVIDGIRVFRHPLPAEESSTLGYLREYSAALWHEWRLARMIYRQHGFDVIHACNPPDLIFLVGIWFKLLHGTRFLFDHHDLSPELYESKFGRRGVFHALLRGAEKATFRLANRVISTNMSYRQIACTRGGKSPDDVDVVRSGPDLSRFTPVPPDATYKRGRRFLVGYLGVMNEFDGVDHLIAAAHELVVNRGRRDIHFVLIGDGPMRPSLSRLAASLRIEDCVELTGRIPDTEMIARLCTCDVGVDPDPMNPLNDKSTMNKILEYMALGLPVVQYDLTEGRRSAAEASVYAEPNNPVDLASRIEELLDDVDARQNMAKVGQARLRDELEWRHQAPKLLSVYSQLLEKNGSPR